MDLCSEIKHSGEIKVSMVMMQVFLNWRESPGLMLDVGANTGYYSLLAARMGHNAMKFDLQPTCQKIL